MNMSVCLSVCRQRFIYIRQRAPLLFVMQQSVVRCVAYRLDLPMGGAYALVQYIIRNLYTRPRRRTSTFADLPIRISAESKSADQSRRCRIFSAPPPSHLTSSFSKQSLSF